jgi:GlpG protein
MRLVGTVETEQLAKVFCAFLLKEGVKCTYEPGGKQELRIWVHDEDKIDLAADLLQQFKQDPSDPRFEQAGPFPEPIPVDKILPSDEKKPFYTVRPKKIFSPLTYAVILICSLLFIWDTSERAFFLEGDGLVAVEVGMTPIQEKLMFDLPKTNQAVNRVLQQYDFRPYASIKELPEPQKSALAQALAIPSWKGIAHWKEAQGPLFEKIRAGEVWRLFTPCLLHGGLLHILFNMAWVFILCRQVEVRLSRFKTILLMILLGVVSNTAQYLMSGPYFVGYSGIIVGLVGFIWMRQKIAPWEGYPLQKATITFILIFILAMAGLELLTFVLKLFSIVLSVQIANTAHIVGGLCGIALARLPFFARKVADES